MKYLIAFALCIATGVHSASIAKEQEVPIHIGPAIIDGEIEDGLDSIHVGPAIIDGEIEDGLDSIHIGPALIDNEVEPANSPLVQVIVNVNPKPVRPAPVDFEDIFGPPPVFDEDHIEPKPEQPEPVPAPKPPVVSLPGILN